MADDLASVQADWDGWWKIWRARRDGDVLGEPTGDYVASRIDREAGPDPTVIRSTLAELHEALCEQSTLYAAGARQLDVAGKWLQ